LTNIISGEMQTRIIGLGNRLRGDDAIGPVIVEQLIESGKLSGGVVAMEQGGDPMVLLDLISGCRKAVIVDAAEMGCEPGTVRLIRDGDIPAEFHLHTSLHAIDLQDVLALARKMRIATPVSLVAVQIKSCGFSDVLSSQVSESIPEITSIVLKEAENAA